MTGESMKPSLKPDERKLDDLVGRLRQGAGHIPEDITAAEETMSEAATEIERLRLIVVMQQEALIARFRTDDE